ncbi:MFS transporter [Acinetobacter sichuanensis]|uniref:MFS transporter n=1 Tax=Acinetobacter sichuanensis TaxID=2136183 RepID=A0A371YNJ4_9GAMM|nr:aromatic acid/H+ symport family MFS transporter [Acinetobacter sichuanensis]RFC83038.1 MFS transporter [Acinetobacter sichuanensis]
MKIIDIQQAVDTKKLSVQQWIIFALCFLVILADGVDTGVIGFIAPALLDDWGISKNDLRPVMSVALIGMAVGAIFSGILADKIGRKWVIIISTLIFGILTILTGLAENTTEMVIYRFLTGLGLGAAMPNAATLVSEYMPAHRRAWMVNLLFCALPLGITVGGILSAGLLSSYGWSVVLYIGGAIPVIVAILAIFLLKESLHFLIKKEGQIEALQIVEKIQGHKIDAKLIPVKSLYVEINEQGTSPVKLVIGKFLLPSMMIWLCCFMSLLVFYVLTSWMPTLLKESGFTPEQFSLVSAVFPFGGVAGTILIGWFMSKYEPNQTISIAYFVSAILFVITGFFTQNIYLLALFIFLSGAGIVGAQSSLPSLSAIFYPAECRGVGVSWMHGLGRFGAIFGAFFGAYIFTFDLGISGIFFVLALPILISALALFIKGRYARNRTMMPSISKI